MMVNEVLSREPKPQVVHQSMFGRALARFFQEEALMLADLAPAAAHDYLRALWFEAKRSNWPCASGAMEDLMAQFLAGAILPTRDPQLQAARAAVRATRAVLDAALGPASAAVVADRALALALSDFPAARDPMTSLLV